MNQTEAFLASEKNNLSAQERNRALEDAHCVQGEDQLEETPQLVEKLLADFDQAARKEQNTIYEMAMNQNRAYVEALRLKLLRANLYDVDTSVLQMMELLKHKAKYFGEDKVAREIFMSDLTEEDINLMRSGIYHIQEDRDRMGRPIVHIFDNRRSGLSPITIDSWMRVTYYYMWWSIVALPNDDAYTKHGAVVIVHVPLVAFPDLPFYKETMPFATSIPVPVSSMHICLEKSSGGNNLAVSGTDRLLIFVLKMLPQHIRARCSIHYCSSMEIQNALRSYGIPTDSSYPLDRSGNFREEILKSWLSKHLQETKQTLPLFARAGSPPPEQEIMDMNLDQPLFDLEGNGDQLEPDPFPEQIVAPAIAERPAVANEGAGAGINPTERDVLFGRGTSVQSHAGNIRFREFLKQHRDEYDNAPRHQRQEVTIRLVQILRRTGVRFLRKSALGEWIETDIVQAENKAGQYLRELRKGD